MPSVFIKTYGCQMNERDSEAVAAQLEAKGYSMTADALSADVILLNTCSVRDAAEQKALGKMNHVAGQLRSKNRKASCHLLVGYLRGFGSNLRCVSFAV